jgi:hypothetical protein
MKRLQIISLFALMSVSLCMAQNRPSDAVLNAALQSGVAQNVTVNQNNNRLVQQSAQRRVNTTVQQIGNLNNVQANIQAYSGRVGLNQFGNNNDINVNLAAGLIDENVVQIGQNHSLFNNSTRATLYQNATVYQRGANQNLIMQGNNNMSRNMVVNMRGRNQTVIIRNFGQN